MLWSCSRRPPLPSVHARAHAAARTASMISFVLLIICVLNYILALYAFTASIISFAASVIDRIDAL